METYFARYVHPYVAMCVHICCAINVYFTRYIADFQHRIELNIVLWTFRLNVSFSRSRSRLFTHLRSISICFLLFSLSSVPFYAQLRLFQLNSQFKIKHYCCVHKINDLYLFRLFACASPPIFHCIL